MKIILGVLALLAVGVGSFLLGRHTLTRQGPSKELRVPSAQDTFIRLQARSLDALSRYLLTSDSAERTAIENARNEDEILATRIYLSFWDYCRRGMHPRVRDRAEADLKRNPHLTLMILRPILKEDPERWCRGILLSEGQEIYVGLCAEFASIESDDFAHGVLQGISRDDTLQSAQHARRLLTFINSGENFRAKSQGYRETKSA